jgi:hypothetical protein
VRTTGESGLTQSPSTKLIIVSVGKTQSQIMMANWCLLGGGTRLRSLGAAGVVIGDLQF